MEKEERKNKRKYQQKMREIAKRQELIGMLEAVIVLGKYLPDEEKKMGRFYGIPGNQHLLPMVDLAHQTFYKTFYKILPDLLKKDFIIDLSYEEFYERGLCDHIENVDDDKNDILEKEYNNMTISYEKFIRSYDSTLFKNNDKCKINLIDFLLENDMYEVVTNLLISDQVSGKQKFNILKEILEHQDNFNFYTLFDTIPSTYKPHNYANKEQEFNEKLFANLSELRNKIAGNYFEEFLGYKIRNCIFDEWSFKQVINKLIQFNLIDINESLYFYQGKKITNAVALYLYGLEELATYLYNLPSYKEIDDKIIYDSDKALLELSDKKDFQWDNSVYKLIRGKNIDQVYYTCKPVKNRKKSIYWLIEGKNFTNNSDRMLYILNFIDKWNSSNDDCYTEEEINEIIDILIRKTKKEDYKEVKRVLEERKQKQFLEKQKQFLEEQNQVVLAQKRQEFTSLLRNLDDTLLESVPARKKIKEIEFKK